MIELQRDLSDFDRFVRFTNFRDLKKTGDGPTGGPTGGPTDGWTDPHIEMHGRI